MTPSFLNVKPTPQTPELVSNKVHNYKDILISIQNKIIGKDKNKRWKTSTLGGVDKKITSNNSKVHITNTMNEILKQFQRAIKTAKYLQDPHAKEEKFKLVLQQVHLLVNAAYIPGNKGWYATLFGRDNEANNFYLDCRNQLNDIFGQPKSQTQRQFGH